MKRKPCEATAQLWQLKKTLRQRTLELAASHRLLEQGVVQRKALEDALREKTEHYAKLAAESRDLQQCLQNLTRRILSAQENERATISQKLHNDMAQVLLGIQVRLVALKKEVSLNTTEIKKEIASTQRLVEQSTKTLDRFADRFA